MSLDREGGRFRRLVEWREGSVLRRVADKTEGEEVEEAKGYYQLVGECFVDNIEALGSELGDGGGASGEGEVFVLV